MSAGQSPLQYCVLSLKMYCRVIGRMRGLEVGGQKVRVSGTNGHWPSIWVPTVPGNRIGLISIMHNSISQQVLSPFYDFPPWLTYINLFPIPSNSYSPFRFTNATTHHVTTDIFNRFVRNSGKCPWISSYRSHCCC